MTKKIHLRKKKTGANTQYYEFYSREEKDWLLGTMALYMPRVAERMIDDTDFADYMNKKDGKHFGKYRLDDGIWRANTPWRFWAGFLDQHFATKDKDISEPQLDGVERLMIMLGEPVVFEFHAPSNVIDIQQLFD